MSGILPENHQLVSGAGNTSGTGATTLIAAPSEGAICVTSLQLGRTDSGTSPITVALSDSAPTVLVLPGNADGVSQPFVFDSPLVVSAQTALTMKASSGVSTLYGSAQGFLRE